MKYKVGDEVLVKVRIHRIVNHKTDLPYEVKRINNGKIEPRTIWIREEDIQSDSQMTAEEAWEIAKKLFADYSNSELDEIFGKGWSFPKLMELTPQEAKAKIEAWEAEKDIKVGDVVNVCGDIGVITSFGTDGDSIHVIYSDGIVNSYRKDKDIKKTGSHIDIDWFLKKIGGDE